MSTSTANVIHANDYSFKSEVLDSNTPVLVDFWAEWCGPCRMLAPVIEQIAENYNGKIKVVKVNTDDAQNTAAVFQIMAIPSVYLFKNGEAVERIVGVQPAQYYEQAINRHL